MSIRFSFGGDAHIFAEVSEEMSLEAFFTSLSMTNAVKQAGIRGVTEICPANASFQIKYDPDQIKPGDLLRELQSMEGAASKSDVGRPGYCHLGIPISGGMDRFALRAANLLVGNDEGAAMLEAVVLGPEIEFTQGATVAVTGAVTGADLIGQLQPHSPARLVEVNIDQALAARHDRQATRARLRDHLKR